MVEEGAVEEDEEVVGSVITSGPKVIKKFSCSTFMLNSAEHEICPANKSQLLTIVNSFLLNIAEHENLC